MATDLYVDTDEGDNDAAGTSWATAKVNLYHALIAIPSSVSDTYVVHCRGGAADTLAPALLNKGTTSSHKIIIQTDLVNTQTGLRDRHSGVWDDSKYHLEFEDKGGIGLNEDFVDLYGLQLHTISTVDAGHTIDSHPPNASSVQKIAGCIFRAEISADTDLVAVHSGDTGTLYAWNNIVYGYRNGTADLCIAFTAYRPTYLYNNTIYDCRTGVYAPNSGSNAHLVNNLFINVSQVGMGYLGAFASDTDYNSTDAASLGLSITGGGGSHNKTSINTTGLFRDATGTPRNLHLLKGGTADVIGSALADPASGLFTDDIDGRPRGAVWDRGADQLGYGWVLVY